jgi:hypothetical protein
MTWLQDVAPYAQRAAAGTGLPVPTILGQWGHETGWGTSALAKLNNLGGIKYIGAPGSYPASGGAGYNTLDDFVRDYIRVVNLSFYAPVRDAAARGADPVAVGAAWGGTPYAEDPAYGSKVAGAVARVLAEMAGVVLSPPAAQAPGPLPSSPQLPAGAPGVPGVSLGVVVAGVGLLLAGLLTVRFFSD